MPDAPKRLALTGGPLRPRDRWIVDHLQRAGATVVLDATDTPTAPSPPPSRKHVSAPLPSTNWRGPTSSPSPTLSAARTPFSTINLRQQIAATGAQALVVLRPLCCDQWHGQVGRLKSSLNIPVFDLELPLHDGDRARTIARLDALMDTLR